MVKSLRRCSIVGVMLALCIIACSGHEAVLSTSLGSVAEPVLAIAGYCRGFFVGAVTTEPGSFPMVDPDHLLASAEGCGPRTLNLSVSTSVAPEVSLTGTYAPQNSELSAALGYSVTDSLALTADSTVPVPIDGFAQVDAYPMFQRTTFQIMGTACPGDLPVGGGTALKPVGVLFTTCGIVGDPACDGFGCADGVPVPIKDLDAGAEDASDGG